MTDDVIPDGHKRCSKCATVKPIADFGQLTRAKDGLKSQCKACTKAYETANKEAIAAHNAEWREANKEAIAAGRAAYRKANKDAIAAR